MANIHAHATERTPSTSLPPLASLRRAPCEWKLRTSSYIHIWTPQFERAHVATEYWHCLSSCLSVALTYSSGDAWSAIPTPTLTHQLSICSSPSPPPHWLGFVEIVDESVRMSAILQRSIDFPFNASLVYTILCFICPHFSRSLSPHQCHQHPHIQVPALL